MSDKKTRFIPVRPDIRGYANIYECEHCRCWTQTGYYVLELDYNFCPWCGAEVEEDEENEA